jgi:hypothetical protein
MADMGFYCRNLSINNSFYVEIMIHKMILLPCLYVTGPGIYFGKIDVTGNAGQDSVTMDTKLIPYPRCDQEKGGNPLAIVTTEFHVLVLFSDRFVFGLFHV